MWAVPRMADFCNSTLECSPGMSSTYFLYFLLLLLVEQGLDQRFVLRLIKLFFTSLSWSTYASSSYWIMKMFTVIAVQLSFFVHVLYYFLWPCWIFSSMFLFTVSPIWTNFMVHLQVAILTPISSRLRNFYSIVILGSKCHVQTIDPVFKEYYAFLK
jgi:hypothetical protein